MNPKWAEENLQTIRTLMERSALYRRALAPVMLVCGIAGLAGGAAGWLWRLNSSQAFILVWLLTALFALTCSLLLMRKQALKESEPFWSAPTRRIAQALAPPFLAGTVITGVFFLMDNAELEWAVILTWCFAYGCGIHAAGFFMPRGIRWLGWLFIIAGIALLASMVWIANYAKALPPPHLLMAAIFGGLHLAYGIYLYFTEKKNPA
jgi:hypothetical protein